MDGSRQVDEVILGLNNQPSRLVSRDALAGDYRLTATVSAAEGPPAVMLFYASNADLSTRVSWTIQPEGIQLARVIAKKTSLLCHEAFMPGPGPWRLSLLKRGSYSLLRIDGQDAAWTMHPSGDTDWQQSLVTALEPETGYAGLEVVPPCRVRVQDVRIEPVAWAELPDRPLLSWGPPGSWYEGQLFPGALLKHGHTYYLYVNGSDLRAADQESGGRVRIGVAVSQDLVHWTLQDGFLLEGEAGTWDAISVFANGAVIAPDGRIAISYAAYHGADEHGWLGFGLALADRPEGPFTKHPANPVFPLGPPGAWDSIVMHEHHLTRIDDQYVLFYTGFDGEHDRAGVATSQDLVHWTRHPHNPVLGPRTSGIWWDSGHVRGRSLTKIGDTYYALYEGAAPSRNMHVPRWWDTIGLARSNDLIDWEYHPLDPIIPQQTGDRFDCMWTGWPRMWVEGDTVYLFYAAGGVGMETPRHHASTGLRTVSLERFLRWE